jgi:Holliday junction resolvase RusA-like endonuclease
MDPSETQALLDEREKWATFLLPFPVSVNAMFADGATRRIKSSAYHQWVIEAGWELKRQKPQPIKGPVEIAYELEEKADKRRRDCANFEKGVTDLLVTHGVIEADDNRILRKVSIAWSPGVKGIKATIRSVDGRRVSETETAES